MSALALCPVTRDEAMRFVRRHHRHHAPPPGDLFRVAAHDGERIVGVAIAGRPVARAEDDGRTVEVTRVCVLPEARNAASMLLGAIRRAAWALGYRRVVTMTLASEGGASLRAAGYRLLGERPDRSWNHPGRPRVERMTGPKFKWETTAEPPAAPAVLPVTAPQPALNPLDLD